MSNDRCGRWRDHQQVNNGTVHRRGAVAGTARTLRPNGRPSTRGTSCGRPTELGEAPAARPVRRRRRRQHRLEHQRRLHQHARSPARRCPGDGSDLDLGLSALQAHVETPVVDAVPQDSTWYRKASGPSPHARGPPTAERRAPGTGVVSSLSFHARFREAPPARQACSDRGAPDVHLGVSAAADLLRLRGRSAPAAQPSSHVYGAAQYGGAGSPCHQLLGSAPPGNAGVFAHGREIGVS